MGGFGFAVPRGFGQTGVIIDLTVAAIPGYFASMGVEYVYLKRRAEREGPSAADYERRDTIASLAMGVGSLVAPLAAARVLAPITPGKGRFAKALLAGAAGAVAVTTTADVVARRLDRAELEDDGREVEEPRRQRRRRMSRIARKVASVGGVASVVAGGVAIATAWNAATTSERFRRFAGRRDLGNGPLAWTVAIFGWDFIYYWNHRLMHTSRYMWAHHVVHHSSERYNLSTALRQPVAGAFMTFVPYSPLVLLGVRPELIVQAGAINLIYQYWIHTDTIRRLGPLESVFNTASHHRVHHASNKRYIDRNHGSILIVWDRIFGTFVPEDDDEPVVYGLTKNVESFSPARIATHEWSDMLADVYRSEEWADRLSFVLRGPGWAYERHAERDALAPAV